MPLSQIEPYLGRFLATLLITLILGAGGVAAGKFLLRPLLAWLRTVANADRVFAEHLYFTAMHARARLRTASGRMTHRELIALCREAAALLTTVENPPE